MRIKAIVERQDQGYVAYLPGNNDSLVGEGDDREEALKDLQSAIRFQVETEGKPIDTSVQEILIIEIDV